MIRNIFTALFIFTLGLLQAQAQSSVPSPASEPASKKEQRQAKREQEAKMKPDYDPNILGHAYFGSEKWVIGTVWYSGTAFEETPLRYDLVRDEITMPPDDPDAPAQKFRLLSEKVDSFTIYGHTFVRLPEKAGVAVGFYDKLYYGKVKVLARRQKYIYQETTYQRVAQRFLTENRYYLYKDRNYHLIKGRTALIKVLKDRKKELKHFIDSEQLDFRNDFEQDLIKVAAYYDSLVK